MKQEFILRLNKAFDHASMAEVARRLGIPHASVRNYYQGRLPAADVLVKIASETNVSLNWLLLGTGDMYANQMPKVGLGRFIEERIGEIVDERLAALRLQDPVTINNADDFDVETAVERLGDPQSVMGEWLRFEGREYPSDYGIVFFKGWETFTAAERVAAVRDAKRVLDRTLGK